MTTTDDSDCLQGTGPGQLVVDTTHLDVVKQVLHELRIEGHDKSHAPAFDLTLLDLEHFDGEENERAVTDLDPVLAELRLRLAARCGGWVPLLGKNRQMTSDFGAYPQTKSHALWDPERAAKPSGWLDGDNGTGVRIGLLDTKIHTHPDIADDAIKRIGYEKAGKARSAHSNFEEGHGVFMAGLILQEAPGATLVSRAALGDDGTAPSWCVVKKLEEFFTDAPEDRVHLLVLASGCRTFDGKAPLIIERAVERLSRHMTIVAAAGNHGGVEGMTRDLHITRNSPTWPAALPGVVAAGLPTPFPDADPGRDRQLDYSPKLPWVSYTVNPGPDGEFISSYLLSDAVVMYDGNVKTDLDTGFASWRGTSCAAASLGGAIAAAMPNHQMDARKALDALAATGGGPVKKFAWQY
jgi:hypothetical protein